MFADTEEPYEVLLQDSASDITSMVTLLLTSVTSIILLQ